jgi:hypothetical protein
MDKSRRTLWLVLALFAVLFVLRFVHLGADPPDDWTRTSLGYMSDPGGYAHNARNKVLWGDWKNDNWNRMYASWIPHWATYLSFVIFGPGVASMNAVPVFFSCLLLLFFFLILRKNCGLSFALIGTLLLGVNYIYSAFSQVAARATPMLFFVVLALYFLNRRDQPRTLDLLLAGAMCFLAFMSKATLLHALPAVFLGVVAYVFFQNSARFLAGLRTGLYFLLGLGGVAVLWLLTIFLPHVEDFSDFAASNLFWLTQGYQDFLKMFWMRPLFFFMDAPLLTLLSSLALLGLAYKALTAPRQLSLLSWVSGFWVVSNTVYFSVIQYRAARHLMPVIVPIVLLALGLLHDLFRNGRLVKPKKHPLLFFAFLFFWLIYAVSSLFILTGRPIGDEAQLARFQLTLVLALLGAVLAYLLFRLWPERAAWQFSKTVKVAMIVFLVSFSVVFNLRSWTRWALDPPRHRQVISRDLGQAFHHIRLAGLVSMVMCLENTHEAHAYSTGYINKGLDFLDRHRITHALLTTHAEEVPNYLDDFPQAMRRARILARYPIWNTYLVLYDFFPEQAGDTQDEGERWEGEAFFGENGIPRFDSEASGRLAFKTEGNGKGALLELPLKEYPAGEYEIFFRLKTPNQASQDERLARIDVTSEKRQRALVQADLFSRDFETTGDYREFSLKLSLRSSRQLRLRMFATGKSELWFDAVTLRRISSPASMAASE